MINSEFGNGIVFTRGDAAREFAHQIGGWSNQRSDQCRWHSILQWMESVDLWRPLHARPGRPSLLYAVENDHEPLANRHSDWCRIRNAYHVLVATTGPLHIQAAGTSQNAAINPSVVDKSTYDLGLASGRADTTGDIL
jgi:hypothetical protein